MSYIGRGIDSIDNISTLDNLSFNGSDATFNLTQNSVAFVPVSADALQIQIDGVIQSGNYTVSGSTVTFDFTPSGSSVCNGIRHFGVGLLTTVSDSSITTAKLGADSVTNTKVASSVITGQTEKTSLADADKFLISDSASSGALKYVQKSNLPSGGLVYLGGTTFDSTVADVDLDHFSSSYTIHKIYGSLRCDTSGANYHLQWRNGGSDDSSNVYTTSIATNLQLSASTTNTTDYGGWNLTYMPFVNATINSSGGGAVTPPHFEMTVYNAMNTTYNKSLSFNSMWYRTANQWCNSTGTMYFNDGGSNTFEGVRLFPSSGNFNKGQIKVYGVVDS
jgi:hypothetical protein